MTPNPYTAPAIRCAGPNCEAVKQTSNHWFVVASGEKSFECWPLGQMRQVLQEGEMPVCGQSCAQRLFEKFMREAKGVNHETTQT